MYLRFITSLLLFSVIISNTQAQDYEKANALYEAEQYATAAIEYEKVIPWLKKELGTNDTTGIPTYYYLLGSSYFYSGQTEKAFEIHSINHQFCVKNFKGSSEMHINSLKQLCEIANIQQDREGYASYRYEIIVSMLKKSLSPQEELNLAFAYNDYGIALYNLGKDEDAITYYQKSLALIEKHLGQDNIDFANVSINIANSFIYSSRYKEAEKSYSKGFEIHIKNDPLNYANNFRTMQQFNKELIELKLYEASAAALKIDIKNRKEHISTTDTSLIDSYISLSHTYYYQNQIDTASNYLDSAHLIIDANYKPNTSNYAFWNSYLATNYEKFNKLDKAIRCANNAYDFYSSNNENKHALQLVNNTLLNLYTRTEEFEKAIKHGKVKLDFLSKDLANQDNFTYYANAVSEQIDLLGKLVKHQEAIDLIDSSISKTLKHYGKNIFYINLLDEKSNQLLRLSRQTEAIAVTEERCELLISTFGEKSPEYAIGINHLGLIYMDAGEYIKALEYFHKASPILSKDNPINKANVMVNIARSYTNLGNYPKAEKHYLNALDIHNKSETNNEHYCATLLGLGALYTTMYDFENAEKYLLDAKELIEQILGKENEYYAATINTLANVYLNTRRYEESIEAYSESIDIAKLIYNPDNPIVGDFVGNLGHALCVIQKFDLGIDLLERVRARLIKTNGKQNPKTMLNAANLGFAYHSNNDDKNASILVKEQFETINNNINYNLKYLGEGESLEYLKQINIYFALCYSYIKDKSEEHPEIVEIGLNSLLQTKGKLLNSNTALKNQILNSKDDVLIETYKSWLEKINAISHIQTMGNIDLKLLEKTQEEATKLEKLLMESSKEFAKSINQKYDWKDIRDQLNDNQTVVEFIKYNYQQKFVSDTVRYGAFIFNSQSTYPIFVDICREIDLINIIGKYGGNNLSYINGIYGKKGEKSMLHDLIWEPIQNHLPKHSEVIISPDGLLHKISFAGISDGTQFMNQAYQIRNVSTATAVLKKQTALKTLNPVIIGGIDYDYNVDKDADHIWTYLDGTKIESKEIEQKFQEKGVHTSYFTDGEANETQLSEILPTKNIAHIATHGFFYPKPSLAQEIVEDEVITDENVVFRGGSRGLGYNFYVSNKNPMMRSGIALSGANQVWNRTDIDMKNDGVLTAQDIAIMDLRNLELMVLSACETGLGDIQGSEGVYGLQRSMKMAGVKNIIMSLWQVPDNETKEFMVKFYSFLLESKDINDSFRKAQMHMSKKYDAFYWAAFVLI